MQSLRDDQQLAKLVAAAICSGEAGNEIVADFIRAGAEESRVEGMVRWMSECRARKRHRFGVGLIAWGFVFVLPGLAVTLGSEGEWIWYGPMVCGVGLGGAGIYRLIHGSPPLKSDELLRAWESRDRETSGEQR